MADPTSPTTPTTTPPAIPVPTKEEFKNKKVAAGVCGILIGALGVHKFILGMNKPGLIMILVSILTCGIGGAVMGIIGLVEGIIYLTKTDDQFYEDYAVKKKAWF